MQTYGEFLQSVSLTRLKSSRAESSQRQAEEPFRDIYPTIEYTLLTCQYYTLPASEGHRRKTEYLALP